MSASWANRPLLPRSRQGDDQSGNRHPDLLTLSGKVSKAVACIECRARKIKCDGAKPICYACSRRRLPCTFRAPDPAVTDALRLKVEELQRALCDLRQVMELLRTAPDGRALDILRNLRGRGSIAEFLAHGSSATPVSSMPWFPENSDSDLDFNLSSRYPTVFPTQVPLQVADLDLRLLGIGKTAAALARSSERRYMHYQPPRHSADGYEDAFPDSSRQLSPGPSVTGPVQLLDMRLKDINIQRWTSVPVSDWFGAGVISFYLGNEHPMLGIFDADLFIDDLVRGETGFCSPLLVSALLAWACATYAQAVPGAQQLSCAFLGEAKMRWREEGQGDTVTAISAAILLTLTCNHHGQDREGLLYLDASAEIGRRLRLFDNKATSSPLPYFPDKRTESAASYAAWGAFGWHTLHSIYFRRKHRIRDPPSLPIPGASDGGPTLPSYMGSTFTWISRFWLIVHELFGDGTSSHSKMPWKKAEAAYQKLLDWSSALPDSAVTGKSPQHHVLIMHTWFHTAAMDLWRPYLKADEATILQESRLARVTYRASLRELQRLIYTYRKKFETTHPTMLITPGLIYILNEIFSDSDSPNAQLYFSLSMHGLLEMAPWCCGLCGIMKAFLGLGWRTGIFHRPGWDISIVENVHQAAMAMDKGVEYNSAYPIDLTLAANEMATGSMEVLASEFQQTVIGDYDRNKDQGHTVDVQAIPSDAPVWRGDPRDLNLTLSKATDDENGMYQNACACLSI